MKPTLTRPGMVKAAGLAKASMAKPAVAARPTVTPALGTALKPAVSRSAATPTKARPTANKRAY